MNVHSLLTTKHGLNPRINQLRINLQDRNAAIIRAQGEARAAELLGPALGKSGAYIQLRRIDAAREISEHLARSRSKAYLDSDTLLLNLTSSLDHNLEKIPVGTQAKMEIK